MRLFIVSAFFLAACGAPMGTADAGDDAGMHDGGHPPRDAGVPDAGHFDAGASDSGTPDAGPPFVPPIGPLLMPAHGGPVLSGAWLITLGYPGVPELDALSALGDDLPDSGWLQTVGASYGVGLLGHTHYPVPGPAPSSFTNADVDALVLQGLDAGWWVLPDAGSPLWMVLYPPQSMPNSFGFNEAGEHFETQDGRVEAWVAPHNDAGVQPYEVIMSHETIEALTDPRPVTAPGFRITSLDDPLTRIPGASLFNGGEVADLCEALRPVPIGSYALTRSWSNDASDAGRNPCQPRPVDAVPWVALWGPTGTLELSAGQRVVLELPALSPEGGVTWSIALEIFDGDADSLDVELSSLTATAGQPITATVIASYFAPEGATASYRIVSSLDGGEPSYTPILARVRSP